MKVYNELAQVPKDKNTVITLGTFDGIHLGHKKILEKVVEKSAEKKARSFVITFYPHPRNVVSDNSIQLLSTLQEKIELLDEIGIDSLFIIKFTKEFSQQSPDKFFQNYIIDNIGITDIVIGYDHHFGKGRGGDAETLSEIGNEHGFSVTTVNEVTIDGVTVSSTKIRNALEQGDIKLANKLLGKNYSFSGLVVEGDKRGRELGFPTANIKIEADDKLLPQLGIYLVEFIVDNKSHYGLLSVGKRPTFYNNGIIIPEVFIYDFDRDIYGKKVTVKLIDEIREEKKYSSADKLIEQMNKDKQKGLELIENLKN